MLDQTTRTRAVLRGLKFVYNSARRRSNFVDYGFDFLFCFDWIASTSKDPLIRRTALRMGRERARRWRTMFPKLPRDMDADWLAQFVLGTGAADRLGIRNLKLKSQISDRVQRYSPRDFFWFDAEVEPPPSDVPADCLCGRENVRGRRTCAGCKRKLKMQSRYEVWLLALIRSYFGQRYGVRLGCSYEAVLRWLPAMRPYPSAATGYYGDFIWAIYAVTHVVYTLNDYGQYRLSPRWLPQELDFLYANLERVIEQGDEEALGEMLDSLKAFGLTDRDPAIRRGEELLMSVQNEDGSWGDVDTEDIYARYHPTVTALDGLREYAWHETRLSQPNLKPLLAKLR